MKKIFLLPVLAVCLISAGAQASNLNATSNLKNEGLDSSLAPRTVLDGVPLMEGLHLQSDNNTLKILPDSGDSASATVVGIADVDDVYNFYQRALPPLGWKAINGRDYGKDRKILHIRAYAEGKVTTVIFSEQ